MQRQAGGAGASNPAGPASGANVTALHGLSGIKVGVRCCSQGSGGPAVACDGGS